jgi:hypothetical protein
LTVRTGTTNRGPSLLYRTIGTWPLGCDQQNVRRGDGVGAQEEPVDVHQPGPVKRLKARSTTEVMPM